MSKLISLAPLSPVPDQRWLVSDLLPRAELVLLDGMSGVGKSLMTATFAACLTVLRHGLGDRLALVLTSPEQGGLVTEFLANQQPNYNYVRGIEYQPDLSETEPAASIAPHLLQFIETAITEHHPVALLIDSLEELLQLAGETDTRQLIDFWTGLRTLAHSHDCTLIIPRKNGLHENRQYGPFTRIGSDIARFGLTMHWHPTDPTMRVVTIAKNLRGLTGGQTHLFIDSQGSVSFNTTDPHEHVRPSRAVATWVPDQQHIVDEDKRIIKLAEGLLDGKAMSKIELENLVTRAGISKAAFQRAMSKAKLRNLTVDDEPAFGPTDNMLFRHVIRTMATHNPPENQARAPGSDPNQQQESPRQPTRPTPLLTARQTG